ncbi:heme exporter protein CcmB [Parasutterella muris]|jgi:heme exporter protein CcmB|uniref:Heme exporter protein B n=1 Tax=Parasutterella muris TaxID=2565572 RepID=A0A6L6YGN7_9BURK|nr:heme exporter protein CcmB [Parasutterella muris]MVX55953.1 heme exporter protein CcmB [Parasutterella muris]
MLRLFIAIVRRDLKLALRLKSDVLNTIFFFIVVVTLVPLGIGPDQQLLRMIAPGVVWVAALLAALLSLPRLFNNDYADGTLEQMLLSGEPLTIIVIAKVFAHWLTTGIPLTVISGLLALMFDLETDVALVLMSALFIGTPVLSLVGSVGAALTLGLRGGSVLTSLLVLPLYVPVLIFGAGAAEAVSVGISATAYFLIVGALTLFSLVVMPIATAAALRIASD